MKQNELLKKYDNVWEQVTSIIYKYFESSPVCKEKYIRTKIIPVIEKSTQIFMTTRYQKKVLKLFVCRCFWLIFFKTGKIYYPQVFLEECKYITKGKKTHNYITDDVELSDFDEDNYNEEILEKIQVNKTLMKKILIKKIPVKRILVQKILMKKIIKFWWKNFQYFLTHRNIMKMDLTVEEYIT